MIMLLSSKTVLRVLYNQKDVPYEEHTKTYPSMLDGPIRTVEVLNIEQDPTGFRHPTANRPW